jgi:hypothetical protein
MLNGNPLPWLLEDDPNNPSIQYFALRDLLGKPEDASEVRRAREAIMTCGPVPHILAAQEPEGNWIPKGGKYQSTPAQIIILAELGADAGLYLFQSTTASQKGSTLRQRFACVCTDPPGLQ